MRGIITTILGIFLTVNMSNASRDFEEPILCFPESELRFSPNEKSNDVSKSDYLRVQKRLKQAFDPFLQKNYGKELKFTDSWNEEKVNGYCTRDMDDNPVINVYGGMARHQEMTLDGLYLIYCHELGHYLGGAPKAFRGRSSKRGWSSAEGQSDYFATSKCLKKLFNDDEENKKAIRFTEKSLLEKAKKRCQNHKDYYCLRTAVASVSVAKVFHSLKSYQKFPEIDDRDPAVVRNTKYNHPKAQCRLDTFLNGANCDRDLSTPFDDIDPRVGACIFNTDKEDSKESARPHCWYRPADKFE